ncbi:phage portal protein [Mesobacillus stamsii]|uniref:SPP1 family phage portal protein n=1 Tax=Mesobacillus stamsii TaxID=225347 RepID=A0ABU0FS20_9BACI|nr:phage portal protein [Mesobacillus stamsii]MDQ0412713.1 SPP1 family phage portal protein [Mesobacillus stamsii]
MVLSHLFGQADYEKFNEIIDNLPEGLITDEEVLELELQSWMKSEVRKLMILGEEYYKNKTDIRTTKKVDLDWKSNNKLEHDFVKKLVNQKVGYLLSKQPTISTEKDTYAKLLEEEVFNRNNLKTIKNLGKESINKGIAFLYVHYDENGEFRIRKLKSERILPFWADDEHTEVQAFLYFYDEVRYINKLKKTVTLVEYHHPYGITHFILDGGKLVLNVEKEEQTYHAKIGEQELLWERIPLIPFKYNEEEQPLIDSIKSLVDNYNLQASTNADLLADIPHFIYKLVGYEGESLAEFMENLRTFRAIKFGEGGDLDKLQATPQTEAAEKEIDRDRKSIYEFGRGVDTTDDDLGNASGVALRYRYSDLDMDCNILESEFQSSLEHLIWFVDQHFILTGRGDFTNDSVDIIFNRDIIINESEVIEDCSNSVGILDDKTIRENHPWYTRDVEQRLKEQEASMQQKTNEQLKQEYNAAFNKDVNNNE